MCVDSYVTFARQKYKTTYKRRKNVRQNTYMLKMINALDFMSKKAC